MTTLTFQNTTFSVINQQNQIWLSTLEIGEALGYSRPDSVTKIYERHQDEFTPCMTALIDMSTAGGIQKVRVFSLRGTHLIAMFSHTKVAKEFRRWVLDILDREAEPKQLALPEPTISIEFTANEWRRLINVWTLFTRYEESVSFLLKAVAPFAHGHTISSAQFNHSRAKPALLETVPMIRQIIAQLPQTVKFHESRKQIAHKYDF